jgi:pectinesterase
MNSFSLHPGDSLQQAIDALPEGACTIHLKSGVYREKVRVNKPDLTIEGEGVGTVLVYGDAANHIHIDGTPYVTFRTPTLTILGDRVTLRNLCVKNDAGPGKDVGQAVAMAVYGDGFLAEQCCFEARQDTLFLGPLPVDLTKRYAGFLPAEELHTRPLTHRFVSCVVKGDVDFIFGSATALFQDCEIVCLGDGYLAAPSTYETSPLGLCFVHCKIISADKEARPYLARPWRTHGMALFLTCDFQGTFHPERFHRWEKPFHRLYETPFIESPLSKPIANDLLEELKRLWNQ